VATRVVYRNAPYYRNRVVYQQPRYRTRVVYRQRGERGRIVRTTRRDIGTTGAIIRPRPGRSDY
jgi:hypothetical protein